MKFFMAKRQQLDYDQNTLVKNLKASTGQGMNAFFPDPSPTPQQVEISTKKESTTSSAHPKRKQPTSTSRTAVRTDARTDNRSYESMWVLPEIPQKRRSERYAFQFWADQITRLRKLHQLLGLLNDPDDRTPPTLSDLVREALDSYLSKQAKALQKEHFTNTQPSERTDTRSGERTYGRTHELQEEKEVS
jgi:hypothetical protein